ncbi:MAG: heme-binding domain-containing protein [Chloroflexi bacterium]|nr:heme-binding domain-containing protein [Chloroflexota bacterium]
MKKIIVFILIGGLVLFGLIQLIPVDRTNPAVTKEPNWSSPEARALVKDNCFQCHSNETEWPWYSYIAPASWLIKYDVAKGRSIFNYSEWDQNPGNLSEMVENIDRGRMPPLQYTIFHPTSKMNAQQKQALIDALTTTLK